MRRRYRGGNLYACPFFGDDGKLVSLELSQSTGDDNHLTQAGLRFVSELIEALLKYEDGIVDVAVAASVSSLDKSDIPGIVNDIIFPYLKETKADE